MVISYYHEDRFSYKGAAASYRTRDVAAEFLEASIDIGGRGDDLYKSRSGRQPDDDRRPSCGGLFMSNSNRLRDCKSIA